MAAMKEVSFRFLASLGAMIQTSRWFYEISSKKQLNDFKSIDGINLYGIWASLVSFMTWRCTWKVANGHPDILVLAKSAEKLYQILFLSGIFYPLYNQVSYQALTGISPVTFSVGNSLKRVAVIVAA